MPSSTRYRLFRKLEGHQGAINCLVFFNDGDSLLSGADDQSVRHWRIDSSQCIQELRNERWGQEFNAQASLMLAIFDMNDSVEVQALDRLNGQFAVASHSGCIKVFKITNNKLSEAPLWSVAIRDIPRGLAFAGHSNDHLMIFTVYTGEVGSAMLSPDQRTLAVHNLNTDQFDLYPQNPFPASPMTSLTVSTTACGHLIKQCAFAEEQAHSLVCGGDNGTTYIFDIAMGDRLQQLAHKNDSSNIYAVATFSSRDRHLIASGETEDPPMISIWSKPTEMKEMADRHDRQIRQAQEEEARKAREAQAAQKAQEDKLASLSVAFNIAMFLMVVVVALCIWSAAYFYQAVVLSIVL
ncbi:WD40 repeat-like protein [Armillaria gallica]|uniref:WD40 repeat-like protein n=1 Tax=Armillaria gallica TaxID=47427 RepID=A0A2H3DKP8_ARMGA|nr:WD40 repeat-like protein [Armillaria gallica]